MRVLAAIFLLGCVVQLFANPILFERDIRPVLKAHCFHCHGEDGKEKGNLDVRLKRLLLEGGKHGPALVAGEPENSLLLKMIKSGKMPKGQAKLPAEEIELIGEWIAQGAKTARPEPVDPDAIGITEEEYNFWAFQPTQDPKVPEDATNPVDAFLLRQLRAEGLQFSKAADKRTLIRRATFDLTGLPPTPEEIKNFVEEESPDVYAKLIDRLLDSPQYGVRWGRHWLDVAGYADSEGYNEKDTERAWAWRYRDYVVASLNKDLPWDQFIREQLAGDEMVKRPYKELKLEQINLLTATGFLRMAPDGTGSANNDEARNQVMAETLKIVSTSLMGMTVGCAKCHDHRYDPIPQRNYYQLRAIFEPGLNPKSWRTPQSRSISLFTDSDRKKSAEIETEAKKVDAERKKKIEFFIDRTLMWKLESIPKKFHEPLRTAYKTDSGKRTNEQKALLKKYPSVRQISSGSLYLYDREYTSEISKLNAEHKKKLAEFLERTRKKTLAAAPEAIRAKLEAAVKVDTKKRTEEQKKLLTEHAGMLVDEKSLEKFDDEGAKELKRLTERIQFFKDALSKKVLDAMNKKAQDIRATKPEEPFIRALTEPSGTPPITHVLFRGNHDQPKDAVKPAGLSVISAPTITDNDPALPSTGRRTAFASHLTSGKHPLTARVLVNRFWMHHFGRGIVDTPGNFGKLGELPSHPELLDWLANDFMKNGWKLKRLHKLIMTSQAYQQASLRNKKQDAIDPDNRLLGRMNVRRKEAETIRDAILALSGQVNLQLGGKPVPVMEDEVGQFILGKENLDGERKPGKTVDLKGGQYRRSLYVQVRRTRQLSFLEVFDAPTMEPNCTKRPVSTVAPQALIFMNNAFVLDQSRAMASRLQVLSKDDLDAQLTTGWEHAFGHAATPEQLSQSREFVHRQTTLFKERKDKNPELTALANYCQALMSANKFVYVE